MNRKKIISKAGYGLTYLLLAAVMFIIPFCKKSDTPDQNNGAAKVKYTVMSNGNDPLFIIAKRGDDTTIRAYGTRDAAGRPETLTDVMITAKHDTSYLHFNSQHQLSYVQTPNKVQFHFTWLTSTKAAVSVLASDGITQLSTAVDYGGKTTSTSGTGKVQMRTGNATLRFEPGETSVASASDFTQGNQTPNVIVYTTECGGTANVGQVYVDVFKTDYTFIDRFPAHLLSAAGQWGVNLPTNIAPSINPSEICHKLVDVLGYGCEYLETPGSQALCPALSTAVASTGIGVTVAAEIFAGCESLTAMLELYCNTVGHEPVPGAPSPAEMICDAEMLDRKFTFDILLRAMTPGLPDNIYSLSKQVPGNGPYGSLDLNLGSNTSVRKLDLTPAAPVARQAYVANSEVYCVTAGSVVKLSIAGTDGYTDQLTYYISSNQQTGRFVLNVPGAATAGIKDVITLQITLPDGKIIKKTASLVFT